MANPPSTQPPAAPKGQQYGQAGAQLQRQKAVPVAGSATGSKGRPRTRSTGGSSRQGPAQSQPGALTGLGPGEVPSLRDPSVNPSQPVTTGLPTGPGQGMEALQSATFGPAELSIMRGIYSKYPQNEDLRRLIEWTEQNLA